MFFSRRLFNKRYRLLFLTTIATNDRARFNENDIDDESLNNRSNVVDDSLLFLFQNEKKNENENFQFEQHHDDYDVEFDFDIEFDSNNVVFIIEKTKSTKIFFSKRNKFWISISRRSIVVKKNLFSFFECFRFEWMRKIYATSNRTVTKKKRKKKKTNKTKKKTKWKNKYVNWEKKIMLWNFLYWKTISLQKSLYTILWKSFCNFWNNYFKFF